MSTLNIDGCVVRDTAARKGRWYAMTPGATAARHMHYGRIILDAQLTKALANEWAARA